MTARAEAAASQDQESVLSDYVERLDRFRAGRRAIHLHLSRLHPFHRRDQHLRAAAAVLEAAVKRFDGALFHLSTGDLLCLAKGASVADLDGLVVRLRFLFSEDPLVGAAAEGEDRFCTWYDLEKDYDDLLRTVRRLALRRDAPGAAPPPPAKPAVRPLDARHLDEIERTLATADLSGLVRRQIVCFLPAAGEPEGLFEEVYLSIPQLCEAVLPGFDLAANRWLFLHLTRLLDAKMLALVVRRDRTLPAGAFSLNLNVATVMAPEFLRFDAEMRGRTRGAVTVELQQMDVFADLAGYRFARDFLKDRGYRVCLDGADPMSLTLLDCERLGVDLVKLRWDGAMANGLAGEPAAELKATVNSVGRDRVVLCRCDGEDAILAGQALGITMFQGRYIDGLWRVRAER